MDTPSRVVHLWDLHGRHDGFIVERPSSLVLVWKDFRLQKKNSKREGKLLDGKNPEPATKGFCECLRVRARVHLQWQEGPPGVDQVDAGQAVLNGNFLCS